MIWKNKKKSYIITSREIIENQIGDINESNMNLKKNDYKFDWKKILLKIHKIKFTRKLKNLK